MFFFKFVHLEINCYERVKCTKKCKDYEIVRGSLRSQACTYSVCSYCGYYVQHVNICIKIFFHKKFKCFYNFF